MIFYQTTQYLVHILEAYYSLICDIPTWENNNIHYIILSTCIILHMYWHTLSKICSSFAERSALNSSTDIVTEETSCATCVHVQIITNQGQELQLWGPENHPGLTHVCMYECCRYVACDSDCTIVQMHELYCIACTYYLCTCTL